MKNALDRTLLLHCRLPQKLSYGYSNFYLFTLQLAICILWSIHLRSLFLPCNLMPLYSIERLWSLLSIATEITKHDQVLIYDVVVFITFYFYYSGWRTGKDRMWCVSEIFGLSIQYPPLLVHSFLHSRTYMWHCFWKRYDGQVSKFQWFEHERLHINMINIFILA